jgi:hypothetical protein
MKAARRKAGLFGFKGHHPAHRIAAIAHRARSEQHLGALYRQGIDGEDVLQVPAPENGVVHPHPVYDDQDAVGGKAADHGTAPAQLAFLDEHLTAGADDVGGGLRRLQRDLPGVDAHHLGRAVAGALFPARGRHHHRVHGHRNRLHVHNVPARRIAGRPLWIGHGAGFVAQHPDAQAVDAPRAGAARLAACRSTAGKTLKVEAAFFIGHRTGSTRLPLDRGVRQGFLGSGVAHDQVLGLQDHTASGEAPKSAAQRDAAPRSSGQVEKQA